MKTLKIAGICALCGQIAAILFLLLFSFLLRNAEDPASYMPGLCLILTPALGTVCGALSGYFDRERPLPCGLLCGALFLLFCLILSVVPGGEKPVWQSVLLLTFSFLCPAVSALITGRITARTGRRRRRSRRR